LTDRRGAIGSREPPASFLSSVSRPGSRTDRSTVAGNTAGSTGPAPAPGAARQTDHQQGRGHSSSGNSRSCWPSARTEPTKSVICASFSLRAGKLGRFYFAPVARERQDAQPYLTPGDVQTQRAVFRQRGGARHSARSDRADTSAGDAFAESAARRPFSACGSAHESSDRSQKIPAPKLSRVDPCCAGPE
jgi:hypothetical protein